MKKLYILIIILVVSALSSLAQFEIDYDPQKQATGNIQYFTPVGGNQFVGDCIPFYHNGTYYLYWLIDEGHHSSLHGLGGHQWVLSTSNDLKEWKHYPIVIGIDDDWEKSICTGSVAFDGKNFYAFYATRLINEKNEVNEQLSYAISNDGIHFEKQKPNPFYTSAPGYNQRNFRDPKVTIDSEGVFHLFVSSQTDWGNAISEYSGCLVHLSSKDLKTWKVNKPVISGERDVPECPDYFKWNDWYYLVYSLGGRTFYVMSKQAYGPWVQPAFQAFDEDWSNVVKTAEFPGGRRIAASWIPSKRDNKDNGGEIFGGSILLREVIQRKDGTLTTKFPKETMPEIESAINPGFVFDQNSSKQGAADFQVNALGSIGVFHSEEVPVNSVITMDVEPNGNYEELGFYLRSTDKALSGYKLSLSQNSRTVRLANTQIESVAGLNKPFTLQIIMKDDFVDVCINNQRCIVDRLMERKGNSFWIYAKHGNVTFKNIKIQPITTNN